MRVNCARWLLEELELLKPTIIVFHDRHAQWVLKQAYESQGWTQTPFPGDTTGLLHEVAKGPLRADVLYLHHPSRGWMDRQWEGAVEPALALLRTTERIPG